MSEVSSPPPFRIQGGSTSLTYGGHRSENHVFNKLLWIVICPLPLLSLMFEYRSFQESEVQGTAVQPSVDPCMGNWFLRTSRYSVDCTRTLAVPDPRGRRSLTAPLSFLNPPPYNLLHLTYAHKFPYCGRNLNRWRKGLKFTVWTCINCTEL